MSAKKFRAAGFYRAAKYSLLASTVLAGAVHAQTQDQPAAGSGQIEEIVVTAEKRSENLQSVPISIQAFSGKKLEQMNATEFTDYAKFLPSVVFQSLAPSQTLIYMRGISIAGGADGNHSGPLPTVGLYLDEQPLTTILGNIDVHLYDIERIEALAGPQGTLFGASSESGTLRIITNKPDPTAFHAGYNVEVNTVHGDIGNVVEGFVNVPLSDRVAIRLVGFEEIDGGYIDNVPGSLHYAGSNFTLHNNNSTENNFNGVETYGGRGALGIQLDDDWTITPTIMGQDQRSTGVFGYDPHVGDLKVSRYFPDNNHDSWVQTALTVQGKIGDFDLVYSTGFFDRGLQSQADYSDYTAAYANAYGSSFSEGFLGPKGQPVNPTQRIIGRDHFTKQTQELRISSPTEDRFHFVAGVFYERQAHKISQDYVIQGLGAAGSITGWPGTFWLTQQMRVDRDMAAYAQGTYEIDDSWSVEAGVRVFDARNSLYGFYGFGPGNLYGSGTGENNPLCHIGQIFEDAPCAYLNKTVEEVNATFKATLTYKFDSDHLVYATASSGFRPGGVNRAGVLPPYTSDTLYNYEFGWKTSWDNNQFRWNGALFWENWDNFQFAFLGLNSLTQIANAASATVRGLETDFTWAVDPNLTLSGSGSFINSELDKAFCQNLNGSGCPPYAAPAGIPLPVTPAVKLNVTARYEWDVSDALSAFVQSSLVFQGRSTSDLRVVEAQELGALPAYASVDMSAGVTHDETSASIFLKNAFDERGQLYRYSECSICQTHPYIVPITPLTFGVKFGQKF
jgi:iron complex outermembrane receptor protein